MDDLFTLIAEMNQTWFWSVKFYLNVVLIFFLQLDQGISTIFQRWFPSEGTNALLD